MIRRACKADAEAIARIYNHYIGNTIITFEEALVSTSEMDERINDVQEASLPWLVFESADVVVGYAYATQWKTRSAYRFSVETTIYVDPDHVGVGIGSTLYQHLLDRLKELGLHSAIGGIALPNPASVALHEKLGFRKAGHFSEVGFKFATWIDVGYWELSLQR